MLFLKLLQTIFSPHSPDEWNLYGFEIDERWRRSEMHIEFFCPLKSRTKIPYLHVKLFPSYSFVRILLKRNRSFALLLSLALCQFPTEQCAHWSNGQWPHRYFSIISFIVVAFAKENNTQTKGNKARRKKVCFCSLKCQISFIWLLSSFMRLAVMALSVAFLGILGASHAILRLKMIYNLKHFEKWAFNVRVQQPKR